MKIGLHWFRCDLRLGDNISLHAACVEMDVVIPVFIFDPAILQSPDTGAPQVAYMLGTLAALEKDVEAAGGRLVFRHGKVEREMESLLQEAGVTHLFYNRDYEPYARERDAAVEKLARARGIEVRSFKDGVVHEPDEVRKEDGKAYGVFTPYRRVWDRLELPPVVGSSLFPARAKAVTGIPRPSLAELGFATDVPIPPTGEKVAHEELDRFIGGDILRYKFQRHVPAAGATSRMSPHLRMGTISSRTMVARARKAAARHPEGREDIDTFISEVTWRDFYRQILWHFPHVATTTFKAQFAEMEWENDERLFRAWCEGRTGFPIVDAGMRQLNTTGWMHNRVRMIVASFLTKDLLISYQWGERYFMQRLFDADLACNNGGWQWSAGTGTDAQPYFRIFNPAAQAEKFDPEGKFIHRFVPEVDSRDYPAPIIDHAVQRVKALKMYKMGDGEGEGKGRR